MLSEPSRLLEEDHDGVDRVLQQLETALEAEDVESVEGRLDLFWARLAVHIRAEHLHLFPTLLKALQERKTSDEGTPSTETAQTTIARLREDHDFFMHDLANAVTMMREVRNLRDDKTTLKRVAQIVGGVKQWLSEHNKAEELEVYRWVILLLNSDELTTLASLINVQLGNRPSRFTEAVWTE
jgi:tRNA nucleotidyltransferase/poly(A) polymerase